MIGIPSPGWFDLIRNGFQAGLLGGICESLGVSITVEGVFEDHIHMAAADDIVELVEEHRAPGVRQPPGLRAGPQALRHGIPFFSVHQTRLQAAVTLFDIDPCAVTALENRVEVAGDRWKITAGSAERRKELAGRGQAQLPLVLAAVEYLIYSGRCGLTVMVGAVHRQQVRSDRMRLQHR